MAREEKKLVQACQKGEESAYEELISLYEQKVFNTALRLVNKEEAPDITQDVFLKIFKNIKKFKGNSSLNTWIYRITVNTTRDFLRKKQRHGSHLSYDEEILDLGEASKLDRLIQKRQLQDEVQKAIMAIGPNMREVLVLRELEGLSYHEISSVLKLAVGTVKSRLARARGEFRRICQERGLGQGEM